MSEFAPEADVQEQREAADPAEDTAGLAEEVPPEADEADASEQQLAVPPGDDDYR